MADEIKLPEPIRPDQTLLAVEGKVEPKAGWKTTEFYLSLGAVVLGAFMTSGLVADGSVPMRVAGMASVVLGALGYTVSRGMAKRS